MPQAPSTGSCAAAAAKAAALHGLGAAVTRRMEVPLPGSGRIAVELLSWGGSRAAPWACVRKPANDDPDATREAVVAVSLRRSDSLVFRAGPGVGTVSRPGLQLAPGEPAINPGPRSQIAASLLEAGRREWVVTVSVQGGEAIAARTFNPRLGVVGGVSILGTAGVVRPWSNEALAGAIEAHISVVRAKGQDTLLLVPGHMGMRAAGTLLPGLEAVEVGNAWGDALDGARRHGFREIVALGHPGKLVKLAQGQWDTRSSEGSSAPGWAFRFLSRCLHDGIRQKLRPAGTLEGLLAPLDPASRAAASNALASRSAAALARRAGVPARVVFVDLKGEPLGEGRSS